jgi:ferric-dicitrate binding protein FerR (iron transport regulator)
MSHRFAAACALLVLASLSSCQKADQAARTTSARVDYVNGEVTIDGAAAEPGATIKPAFTVVTGASSSCGIVFDEKNILHIDENTDATIDLSTDIRTVNLRRGMLACALRKLARIASRDQEAFRVATDSAVAGVRGTVFLAKVEDETRTYLCDCNGVLDMRDSGGGNAHRVEAAHHKAYRFTRSGDTFASAEAGLEYHTDQMMELGLARIGETIDWTKVGK